VLEQTKPLLMYIAGIFLKLKPMVLAGPDSSRVGWCYLMVLSSDVKSEGGKLNNFIKFKNTSFYSFNRNSTKITDLVNIYNRESEERLKETGWFFRLINSLNKSWYFVSVHFGDSLHGVIIHSII
jgi:hypothetical protein